MEEVTWFFNSDFEQKLFSKNQTGFNSSKQTQEFEYFISLISPSSTIYTSKKYSEDYKIFFKNFTGKNLKTTHSQSHTHNWCQEFVEKDTLRKYQNKITTLTFFQKEGLFNHYIEPISSEHELKPNLLYKDPYSLSGIGHYTYPKDSKKLKKLLNSHNLLAEEILTRIKDFSTLFKNQKILGQYENLIDDYYQYKGTRIYPEKVLDSQLQSQYAEALKKIQDYTKEYQGIYSVDSFLYEKKGVTYLQPICELNMRKTMGYTAIKLKEKYFSDFSHFDFLLKRNSKDVAYEEVEKRFNSQVQMISPNDNLFQVWLLAGNSVKEVDDQHEELLSTFF